MRNTEFSYSAESCKNCLFQRPPLRLALQTKQCFVLPLRLALQIKAVLLFLLRLRMMLPRIKENLEFKNKMPVNFLTDWHYACWTAFAAAPEEYASILRKMQQRRLQRSLLENGLRILHSPRPGNKKGTSDRHPKFLQVLKNHYAEMKMQPLHLSFQSTTALNG